MSAAKHVINCTAFNSLLTYVGLLWSLFLVGCLHLVLFGKACRYEGTCVTMELVDVLKI